MATYHQSSRFQEKESQQRMIWLWSKKNLLGNINFNGGASSVAPTYPAIVQEAVVEASIKARDLGF